MGKVTSDINIVEYHNGLAEAVADMWNNSQEGWGGSTSVKTGVQVKVQEANSSNIKVFLAMDGELVVGYCSLSEYREDRGAMYIPLLNVRPDYHGKKIGKMLVTRVLNEVIQRKWPRLDLYTWPGNTKAVPLYKKCGFFWEDRDDTTHLMNFIPTVLATDAVKDYFAKVDWYTASDRQIEVVPDDIKRNHFVYYEYSWNDEYYGKLRMHFERSGRGLRLIETDDYLIEATVEDFELVCNKSHQIQFHVINKNDKPLQLRFEGEEQGQISFLYENEVKVKGEKTIEAMFSIADYVEEQSPWRTHPAVQANVWINGKKATFAIGVNPKLPANIKAAAPQDQFMAGEEVTFFLDIENQSKGEQIFSFSLPSTNLLTIKQQKIEVTLQGKEKMSIPIDAYLHDYGFYGPEIEVSVIRDGHIEQTFNKRIGVGFKGIGAQFDGECDEYWHIYNGSYQGYFSKFNNQFIPGRIMSDSQPTTLMFPKLGKPYNDEFSKKKPKKVEFEQQQGAMILKATFESESMNNISFVYIYKLFAEGLIEAAVQLTNEGNEATSEDVWISQPIYHSLENPIFHYNHDLVEHGKGFTFYGEWESSKLTENWIFSQYKPYPSGFCWPKQSQLQFENWYTYCEQNLGKLDGGVTVQTEPIFINMGAFQTWKEFRRFAERKPVNKQLPQDAIEVVYNARNPVISTNEIVIKTEQKKNTSSDGTVQVTLANDTYAGEHEVSVPVKQIHDPFVHVKVKDRRNNIAYYSERVLLKPSNDKVVHHIVEEDDLKVHRVNNGLIEIGASTDFFPTLFSLKMNGVEWLDSSFPKLTSKSWWNPWSGGIRSTMSDLSNRSWSKESSSVQFATLNDQFHNVWEGLEISTSITKHEKYKGLNFHQYFVMLPGVPVVAHFSKIDQHTGSYLLDKKLETELSIKPNSYLDKTFIQNGDVKVTGGGAEYEAKLELQHAFGGDKVDELLHIIQHDEVSETEVYMNKDVNFTSINQKLHLANRQTIFTKPLLITVGKGKINHKALHHLANLVLTKEEKLHENY
ncbi:GNAT family N-acetyltransferase [Bacillus sp. SCS-151]|uniref:GNAT family N-acetyltransferase n=1 Tax=Nanhaiella sioensis TaxID=3115293 RepID=UPI00397A2964